MAARQEPGAVRPGAEGPGTQARVVAPFVAVVDAEQVRAAVTLAFDGAMDTMVDAITRRVLNTLNTRKPADAAPAIAPPQPEPLRPVEPPTAIPRAETVRRVNPLRLRAGSILGLDIGSPEPEGPTDPRPAPGGDPADPQ